MQVTYFVGIDVSKATLDWTVVKDGIPIFYLQIANSEKAVKKFLKQLQKKFASDLNDYLFGMEHTGLYTYFLDKILTDLSAKIWMIAPLHLSRSGGIQRGKNDKVDSERIAQYMSGNLAKYRKHIPVRPKLNRIKRLFALRRQLVKSRKQLLAHQSEGQFMDAETGNLVVKLSQEPINQLNTQLSNIENEILNVIHDDADLSRKYILISSVRGVGLVLTIKILLITNEFKTINQPKKLACMAGIAPFDYESGTSVKKVARTSNMADQELKSLLHMASIVAIRDPGKFRDYYLRKKEEGKHSMKVLNAVRNKLIHCVCACVNNDRLFQKNYQRPKGQP